MIWRVTRLLFAGFVVVALLVWNARLYWPAEVSAESAEVRGQLRFVKHALDRGAAHDAQQLFPEGFLFSWVLYGLAQVEHGLALHEDPAGRAVALAEARRALAAVESPEGTAPFSSTLDPPYGVFYVAWSNWLRADVVRLAGGASAAPVEAARLSEELGRLAAAFERSPTPFLASYPGQAWPVDSVVGAAALAAHDRVLEPAFAEARVRWLERALQRLDRKTNLLPHRTDAATGELLEGARGSSSSLSAALLPALDVRVGQRYYESFVEMFGTSCVGLPAVREYPMGVEGEGDVDSGPLVFGASLSASAVTLAAARLNGDAETAEALRHTADFVGRTPSFDGSTHYLFGALPIADAFLVWAKTRPYPAAASGLPLETDLAWSGYRLPVHLLSALCAAWPLLVLGRAARRWRAARPR